MNPNSGTSGLSTPRSHASTASSSSPPASIIERRNRRRSNTISGSRPAELPVTNTEQKLATLIGLINTNARAAKVPPQAQSQPLPTLVLPALTYKPGSAKAAEDLSPSF